MLIWQRDHFAEGTDVAGLWSNLVNFLRCPLKFSVDSFLLSDENDRVHHFRDALRGQLGRLMSVSRQSGDWWTTNSNRDTEHTKVSPSPSPGPSPSPNPNPDPDPSPDPNPKP